MPFIPHTETEIKEMLATIGINSLQELFSEIPAELCIKDLNKIPSGLTEMELGRLMHQRAKQDGGVLNFLGAGAYEHHIPGVVWDIVNRGEFMTAYTPYQAEASQGTLQLLYEFQTMMAHLTGMEVSNASLYDGASALAEAILMAIRANKNAKLSRVLLPATLHPAYRDTVYAIVKSQNIELIEIPYTKNNGNIDFNYLTQFNSQDIAAIVIPQPNFFGVIEEVDQLTDWAHAQNALVIAVVNPLALALFKEPGKWGKEGADIVCGEAQPFGIPLASGGPYLGLMCCKEKYVRQMPGRIIGRTVDVDGKQGFALTLQAREQHIRRGKATSNICTNQGLLVTAATIYMSLLGYEGLKRVAHASHANTHELLKQITSIPGITTVFNSHYFHEIVVRLPKPAKTILKKLASHGIYGGYDLQNDYPELDNCILLCATETKTNEDIQLFKKQLNAVLAES